MVDLSKWNNMLEDLKKQSRGNAILENMKKDLKRMNKLKGDLKKC